MKANKHTLTITIETLTGEAATVLLLQTVQAIKDGSVAGEIAQEDGDNSVWTNECENVKF